MKKKNALWMLAAILFCGLTAGLLSACGDDDDKADEKQDSMEALCHLMVSEDVLKVADVTVHYLDEKGQQASERMTTLEWKKTWKTTTLPARVGVWAQLTPKTQVSLQDSYQLKVVATAGYLFHAAKGGDWANGWVNVTDPNAQPENVAAADVQKWCNERPSIGCDVDDKGLGKPVEVDFGGNFWLFESGPFFDNDFCEWIMGLFFLPEDNCEED